MSKKDHYESWISRIMNSVGCYVWLETLDGVKREGKMSGVRVRMIILDGKNVDIPVEIELNGSPSDTVDIARLKSIRFE